MSILETKIKNYTDSIESSISTQNYFAALTMTLMLPDILGKLEWPGLSSSKRYSKWFDENMKQKYSMNLNGKEILFLSGNDAYALRCSFLHGGEADISEQRVQEVIERFIFKIPDIIDGKKNGSHVISVNNKLTLRVDLFCYDICNAVNQWTKLYSKNDRINNSAEKIMDFHNGTIFVDEASIN